MKYTVIYTYVDPEDGVAKLFYDHIESCGPGMAKLALVRGCPTVPVDALVFEGELEDVTDG